MTTATHEHFDVAVIGTGPAGQKAAVQAAKVGKKVVAIESEPGVGGACVYHAAIPSKTLRETALQVLRLNERAREFLEVKMAPKLQISRLLGHVDQVVSDHGDTIARQLSRNNIEVRHGRARFVDQHTIEVQRVTGKTLTITAPIIVIATGSKPRTPPTVPVDHDHILDSDSILSLLYLPESLTVLGGGVIASEYASMFAAIGVKVTMIDKADRPLAFLDHEVSARFLAELERMGGTYLGGRAIESVTWDGFSSIVTKTTDGSVVTTEKALCALGRVSNVDYLHLEAIGIAPNERGVLVVDANCQTKVPGIYAVGDVIGPPSLASSGMEQGRRAMRHALGLENTQHEGLIPAGIYTIPEISTIGISEVEAKQRRGEVIVGHASFEEIARAQIAGCRRGFLKLVSDATGTELLGAQIIGEGATELIHVAQMALIAKLGIDTFIEHIFNFPTLAEAYRVAALDIVKQRGRAPVTLPSPAPVGH